MNTAAAPEAASLFVRVPSNNSKYITDLQEQKSSFIRLFRLSGLFQFRINFEIMNRQLIGLCGQGISPSQGHYLHRTTQTE
jgi:hypothetical protein